ncbi:MAG: serine hydrolase [Bacillaceae bacterium]
MLQSSLQQIIDSFNGNVGLLVKDLKRDNVIANYQSEKMVVSASIIKVPIMLAVLKEKIVLSKEIILKEEDKVAFSVIAEQNQSEYSIEELIIWMIITSDNTATNLLIDLLGEDKINAIIKEIGMKKTFLNRKMMDFEAIEKGKNNYTSLQDMLVLMEKLYHGKLYSKEISEYAISILKRQRDSGMLKRYIVDNVIVAHKGGELDYLNHDIGIFYTKKTDYFIGVSITDALNNEEAYKVIGKLSKVIYEYLGKEQPDEVCNY